MKTFPNVKLKEEALILRKKGLSYSEIKKRILVSKSTLSSWLHDIKLTPKQQERFGHN